jgi:two-component system cell cycle response regulator
MMPEMDGLEVIKRVTARSFELTPYIILLTGRDEKSDIISGLKTGANDYIKKPFDHEELFARIKVGERTLELQTRLYETMQTLEHSSTHDPLTGILNRRAILDQFRKELDLTRNNQSGNANSGLSIGYIDVDRFKKINDLYGHQAGDEVLKAIVTILGNQLCESSTFGRLGGDEFLVVVHNVQADECQHLFVRLVEAIAKSPVKTFSGEVPVSVSIGVASVDLDNRFDELLDIADSAMYRAKREGGNRVIIAE